MSRPRDISAQGWRIDGLLDHADWLVGAVAAIAVLWLAWALIAGARRRRADLRAPRLGAAVLPLLVSTLVFFVVDGTLFVSSTRDLDALLYTGAAPAGAVRVEVSAQQWLWNVRYAGPDGRFATADDPVLSDVIVVPVNQPVALQLAASDVVHSLWIPNLRIKRDAIPGRVAEIHFRATELGTYPIACAQFCGVGHYKMAGELRVVSRAEFDRFIAARAADSLQISAEDQRALEDEPSRQPPPGTWPRFRPERFGRDWGWPWH